MTMINFKKKIELFTPNIQRRLLNVGIFKSLNEWRTWAKLQKAMIKKQPYCSLCKWKKKLNVHHILPRHLFPIYALIAENTVVLCRDCHFHYGHFNSFQNFNPFILNFVYTVNNFRFDTKKKISNLETLMNQTDNTNLNNLDKKVESQIAKIESMIKGEQK